jgi:hypothetical protein
MIAIPTPASTAHRIGNMEMSFQSAGVAGMVVGVSDLMA